MKVAIIGANGKIGQHLVEQMQHAKTHEVIAVVRKQEQQKAWQERGVTTKLGDLEGPLSKLEELLSGIDVVIFTAGSGGNTGDDKTLLVDLDGAVKTVEAAEAAEIKRFIMVSAWQAGNRDNWNDELRPYYAAKHYAERELMRSKLNWTIVRPGALTDEEAAGEVSVGESLPAGSVPREDVASVIRRCVDENVTEFKAFDLVSGDSEVEAALQSLKETA